MIINGKWTTWGCRMGPGLARSKQKRMQEGVREEKVGYTGKANGKGLMRFVALLARSLTGWGWDLKVAQGRELWKGGER